ncbi:MFS transporter [Actinocorallia sp. API 0066]|uniref:MFS transporter n=1 Tax=Actinocorallia sp. API 0066 TaxID=2896846 RepID=UPI001E4EBC12|nr:MFS transporter [Actinocorallia sp. API 0066]MCD0451036.1 MFS transporter [Actinocorallia sp. API 0066]
MSLPPDRPPVPDDGHPRRWAVLGVMVVSLLIVALDNTILNVALKTLADPVAGLGASQGQLEWAINSYTLVFAGLLFTFGIIGDRIGRRRVLTGGLVVFGLASLISAYAQSPEQLIWARALMGLGGAAIMPQTLSILSNVFSERERAKAIGIWAGAVGIAIAVGPITGGLLLEHFWWGSVFLVNAPVVAAGVAATVLLVPESRDPSPGRLDPLGVLLSITGLVALTFGIIEGGERGSWLDPVVLVPIAAGLAVLAWFVAHEARTDHPALDVRLFRDRRLSAAVGSIGLAFFACGGTFFFGALYLQSVRGLSPLEAGAMMLPIAAGQMLLSTRAAGLVRRFGPKAVAATGLGLLTLSMGGYALLEPTTPLWYFGLLGALQGAGMASVATPATQSMMSVLPREKAGAGSALGNTARQVSMAMGIAISGSLVASLYRDGVREHLGLLPEPLRAHAAESLQATADAVARTGADALLAPAYEAFLTGLHATALASAAVALLSVLAVLRWMPGKPAAEGPAPREPEAPREEETAGARM